MTNRIVGSLEIIILIEIKIWFFSTKKIIYSAHQIKNDDTPRIFLKNYYLIKKKIIEFDVQN